MSVNKETFCPYPFDTVFLGADGGVKTCCSASGPIGNINDTPMAEIVQGPLAKEIRQSILDGKWHDGNCSKCKGLESLGGKTERTESLYRDWPPKDQMEKFKNATIETFIPAYLDLRWSNTCNLACNYCYEYFSSRWAQIKGVVVNANKEHAEDTMFAFLDDHKNTITNLRLLGGEPLLQKQNLKLFEILPTQNYYILTNLSTDVPNNPIAGKLLTMPNVFWGVSFETIGERFEYVRHGADWKKLNDNLLHLENCGIKKINTHPVYCTYSAFSLMEYYDFITSRKVFNEIHWSVLNNIDGLNVFTLPGKMREKAIKEMENCINTYKDVNDDGRTAAVTRFGTHELADIKDSLIKSLDDYNIKSPKEQQDEYLRREQSKRTFIQWTATMQEQHKTKKNTFQELWPEVTHMLNEI